MALWGGGVLSQVIDMALPNPFNSYGRKRFHGFGNALPVCMYQAMGVAPKAPTKKEIHWDLLSTEEQARRVKEDERKAAALEANLERIKALSKPKHAPPKKKGFSVHDEKAALEARKWNYKKLPKKRSVLEELMG